MRPFWKDFLSRRPDEMERAILFKAQRNAYFFLTAALLVWSLAESWGVYARRDPLNILPCFLLGTAALIQGFSQLILTRRAVKDDEDSRETGPLALLVITACAAAGAVAALVAAVMLMGVRV